MRLEIELGRIQGLFLYIKQFQTFNFGISLQKTLGQIPVSCTKVSAAPFESLRDKARQKAGSIIRAFPAEHARRTPEPPGHPLSHLSAGPPPGKKVGIQRFHAFDGMKDPAFVL